MKIIAHRGNCNGPNRDTENKPDTIISAIQLGFDCEIDVWYIQGKYFLGHDYPETEIPLSFLQTWVHRLWIHCKHLDSLVSLKDNFNCFYHDKDIYTLTSRGYIWGNINSPYHPLAIQVMPEKSGVFSTECYGICTDFPFRYSRFVMKPVSILMSGPIRPSVADVVDTIRHLKSQLPNSRVYLCTWKGQLTDEIRKEVTEAWEIEDPGDDVIRTLQFQEVPHVVSRTVYRMVYGVQSVCEKVQSFVEDTDIVIRTRTDCTFEYKDNYLQELLDKARTHYVVRNRQSSGVGFDDWYAISTLRALKDAWTFENYKSSVESAWNPEDLIRKNVKAPVHLMDESRVLECYIRRENGRKEYHHIL